MKAFKCVLAAAAAVSFWACAGQGRPATAPDPAILAAAEADLSEAESQYSAGCYVPLKKAFKTYASLYAIPSLRERVALPFLKTSLLLSLRQKDVGIVDRTGACIKTAREIVRTNRSLAGYGPWVDMANLVTPPSRGVQTDIVAADPAFDWVKTLNGLLDDRGKLKARAATDDLLACIYGAWNCTAVPSRNQPDDPATILALFPDSILLKYQTAVCGQLPDRQALESIVVDHPEFYEARLHLGELHIRDGVVLTAEKELLKAYEGIPESPQVLILLGSVYYAIEEFDKGLEFYDKTLAVSPEYRDALLGKAVCLASLKRYEESITVLDRIVALGYWLLGESNYWLAWNKRELGRNAEALANIDEAKMRLPMNSEVFGLAGTLAYEQGQIERAEKDFRESLQYNGSNTESLFGLGNVGAKNGLWAESAGFYEKASQVMDGSIEAARARAEEITRSPMTEERKARLLKRNEIKIQSLLYSRATSHYCAATSRLNAQDPAAARRLAGLASEHPSYKAKVEELLRKLDGRRP